MLFRSPYVTDSINNLAVKDAVQPGDVVGISSRSVTTFVVSLQKDITAVSSFTESRFKLYPNPANHSLRVFTSVEKPMLYSMVDLSGKRVAEGLLLPREENEINIRHLVKGWYLFQSDGFSERFLIE